MNNASGTMIRRASELDVGSLVIVGGGIHTVTQVIDLVKEYGVFISIRFDNGGVIIDRASALYTCV
jgi:hypothetical protein